VAILPLLLTTRAAGIEPVYFAQVLGTGMCDYPIRGNSALAVGSEAVAYTNAVATPCDGGDVVCTHPVTDASISETGWSEISTCSGNLFTYEILRVCERGYVTDGDSCVPDGSPIEAKNNGWPQGEACKGNPINIGTGNKFQQEIDYAGAGPFPLTITRYYNSRSVNSVRHWGIGWTSYYDRRIQFFGTGATSVTAHRHDGRAIYFSPSGQGWIPDADTADRIERRTDAGGAFLGWRLTTAEGAIELYDTQGRLVSIRSREGFMQSLAYDPVTGRLATVADPFGRTLTFTFDSDGRISRVRDPAGNLYTYEFDGHSNLKAVTYPGAAGVVAKRTYLYDDARLPHALTGIIDENGQQYANFTYDAEGRAPSAEHAGGADRVSVIYNADGSRTVTDALGTARTYGFATILGVAKNTGVSQPCPGCGGTASSTTYDAHGNPIIKIDFNGNRTEYTYDPTRNLPLSVSEGLAANGALRAESRRTETVWHPRLRLPVRVTLFKPDAGLGGWIALTRTSYAYGDGSVSPGDKDKLISTTVTDLATGASRITRYTYNALNLLESIDGPRTDVADTTTFAYYADTASGHRAGDLHSVTNALGHVITITAYDDHGRPLSLTDPNGLTTTLVWDPRGRLVSRTTGTETTTYAYDAAGNLTLVVRPTGETLGYGYDAAHRLIQVQDGLGNRVVYTLDSLGNRIQEQVLDPTGALAQTRSRVFDALGRLVQDLGAQGQASTYAYDGNGNRTGSTDPLGHTSAGAYDSLNRLVGITDPMNGVTRLAYDIQDRVKQVTDPRGLVTTYTYDGFGNLVREVSPDRGTTVYTYDSAGNLKTRTDARGQRGAWTYDALNRVIQIAYSDGRIEQFTYDSGAHALGRLTRITEPGVTTTYAWDTQGRITQKRQLFPASPYADKSLTYAYDAAGRLSQLTTGSGKVIAYGYTQQRISRITVQGQVLLDAIQYSPVGVPKAWTWGNGTAYARSFDTDGRLASYPLGPLTRTLSFDAASRITGYHHPGEPAWDQSFGYDALGRLSSFTHGMGSQTYRYDANGTELVLNGVPYTYALAAASNQPERGSGGCDLCHARPRRSRQRRRGSIDPETVTEVRR